MLIAKLIKNMMTTWLPKHHIINEKQLRWKPYVLNVATIH